MPYLITDNVTQREIPVQNERELQKVMVQIVKNHVSDGPVVFTVQDSDTDNDQ